MTARRVVVVGGGILGLAVAARAADTGLAVTLVEKEDHWAAHQTGHNSGVVHAGPYYRPGSLKARMCAAGNASMIAFAREYGIPHGVPGKLIVATDDSERQGLYELHRRAVANGVPSRLIDADETSDYEPEVYAVEALRVETTGIIDYSAVCATLARLAGERGADLVTSARVTGVHGARSGIVVEYEGEERAGIAVPVDRSPRTSSSTAPASTPTTSPASPVSSRRSTSSPSAANTTSSSPNGATSCAAWSIRFRIPNCLSSVCT